MFSGMRTELCENGFLQISLRISKTRNPIFTRKPEKSFLHDSVRIAENWISRFSAMRTELCRYEFSGFCWNYAKSNFCRFHCGSRKTRNIILTQKPENSCLHNSVCITENWISKFPVMRTELFKNGFLVSV